MVHARESATKDLIKSNAGKILVTRKVKREKQIFDINQLSVSVNNTMNVKQIIE